VRQNRLAVVELELELELASVDSCDETCCRVLAVDNKSFLLHHLHTVVERTTSQTAVFDSCSGVVDLVVDLGVVAGLVGPVVVVVAGLVGVVGVVVVVAVVAVVVVVVDICIS